MAEFGENRNRNLEPAVPLDNKVAPLTFDGVVLDSKSVEIPRNPGDLGDTVSRVLGQATDIVYGPGPGIAPLKDRGTIKPGDLLLPGLPAESVKPTDIRQPVSPVIPPSILEPPIEYTPPKPVLPLSPSEPKEIYTPPAPSVPKAVRAQRALLNPEANNVLLRAVENGETHVVAHELSAPDEAVIRSVAALVDSHKSVDEPIVGVPPERVVANSLNGGITIAGLVTAAMCVEQLNVPNMSSEEPSGLARRLYERLGAFLPRIGKRPEVQESEDQALFWDAVDRRLADPRGSTPPRDAAAVLLYADALARAGECLPHQKELLEATSMPDDLPVSGLLEPLVQKFLEATSNTSSMPPNIEKLSKFLGRAAKHGDRKEVLTAAGVRVYAEGVRGKITLFNNEEVAGSQALNHAVLHTKTTVLREGAYFHLEEGNIEQALTYLGALKEKASIGGLDAGEAYRSFMETLGNRVLADTYVRIAERPEYTFSPGAASLVNTFYHSSPRMVDPEQQRQACVLAERLGNAAMACVGEPLNQGPVSPVTLEAIRGAYILGLQLVGVEDLSNRGPDFRRAQTVIQKHRLSDFLKRYDHPDVERRRLPRRVRTIAREAREIYRQL